MIQKIDLIRKTLTKCTHLEYAEEVLEDLLSLDGSVLKEACTRLLKINKNPLCGEEVIAVILAIAPRKNEKAYHLAHQRRS
jgi:hypothetical protein